ncbi:hypothetical protein I79_014016 [Cricetulus griseus]|uniref:Uncharacterized protein n=1 Tax=Cricetulus griseus TaxID=10029 RepID=G3HT15_CRIGR|nr:hypothetical protein I79_014016 [Cricetulus griseus]
MKYNPKLHNNEILDTGTPFVYAVKSLKYFHMQHSTVLLTLCGKGFSWEPTALKIIVCSFSSGAAISWLCVPHIALTAASSQVTDLYLSLSFS